RHRDVGRQTVIPAPLMGDDRSKAGMKTDECAATDGNPWRRAGHHVMISGPVVRLIVPDRANDGELVGASGEPGQCFAELHTRRPRLDWRQLPSDLNRSFRLGVERFEMGW